MDRPGLKRRDLAFSAALFILALLPRLYVAIAWAREPVWDGHYYDFGARRIAEGLGYSDDVTIGGIKVWHPWCHYPVGYSAFLALFYRIFGHGFVVAPVVNAVTGAVLAVLVHRLARHALATNRARLAGLFVALDPGLILYAALLMTEPLAALGLVAAGWLVARDAARRPLRGALLAGLALGLCTLVRPQSLLCVPALGLFVVRPDELRASLKRALAVAGVALATALAVVAPWTARNCRVMDGCALVSTNGGWNLAIGASPHATGRFETLRATDGCPVVTGQVQQDRCWMDEGVRWIQADPVRWLGLVPKKLSHTFDHESFPIGYLGEANPAAWPEERKALGRGLLSGVHRALLAFAALGLVGLPRGRGGRLGTFVQAALFVLIVGWSVHAARDTQAFWPLAVAIPLLALLPLPGAPARGGVVGYVAFAVASVALTHAVFFGEDRYHMVITPALCLLAAAALRRPDEVPAATRIPTSSPRGDAAPSATGSGTVGAC